MLCFIDEDEMRNGEGMSEYFAPPPPPTGVFVRSWVGIYNSRLFMAPHLVRARGAYRDIRIRSFHCTHTHAHTPEHAHTHTQIKNKYMH